LKTAQHELTKFEECTLFNSGYAYRQGYDKAQCSCGWESAPSKDHKALVALFELHTRKSS